MMDCLCEPLEDVDGTGMCEVHSGVLTYRQMRDGTSLFEGIAECLRIDVVLSGATVKAEVDVLYMDAERENAGRVMPDTTKHDTADGIGQGGVMCEGVEGARGLVGRAEVEGVVEERRSDAEELCGDEEGCNMVSGRKRREDVGSGAGRWRSEREGEYACDEFFWEGCERARHFFVTRDEYVHSCVEEEVKEQFESDLQSTSATNGSQGRRAVTTPSLFWTKSSPTCASFHRCLRNLATPSTQTHPQART